ncbi:MAG: bifunctional adenosylcobinamide kinase/adenosylcobinamide-phosphate guanylyltransferase [Muribaculaceae bacterium]|nr:bifunctional adenosylcobinamide kinase/adenosylcobinamide-phosphate guanylyltransferase [Muribaculaceae bacterium]
MNMITLVTGGQRSGKSVFSEKLALERSSHPIYVATAKIWDDDFRHRVEIHKQRRGSEWSSIEECLKVGDLSIPENAVVLLDCLTLLSTNWMFENNENTEDALVNVSMQLDMLFAKNADFIVVTNEIGLGGISENPLQRKFADLQGSVNQYVASIADEVYLIISGIPLKLK